jgi:hypothetical protein
MKALKPYSVSYGLVITNLRQRNGWLNNTMPTGHFEKNQQKVFEAAIKISSTVSHPSMQTIKY